jgi:hypothetical protein
MYFSYEILYFCPVINLAVRNSTNFQQHFRFTRNSFYSVTADVHIHLLCLCSWHQHDEFSWRSLFLASVWFQDYESCDVGVCLRFRTISCLPLQGKCMKREVRIFFKFCDNINECGKNKSDENLKKIVSSKTYDRPKTTTECGIF